MQSNNRTKASQKVTIVGALIDFLLSIIKIILGFIGQSGALIADGIHSFSDLLTDWVTWYAANSLEKLQMQITPMGMKGLKPLLLWV